MYPQSMFKSKNKKTNVYPCKPQLYYTKWGVKGYELHICVTMMLNLAVGDTVKETKLMRGCFGYNLWNVEAFSPKRDILFEKLKQELAPETPGFRTLCPDETRRGVEIVVEDHHRSYVYSSYLYIILAKDLS